MSFHGGLVGVLVAFSAVAWRHRLPLLRVGDYVAVNVPFGMMLGRIANFVNGELWGKPSDVPWAMVFPGAGEQPRHPSQLYEAALEGALMILVMLWLFWRTRAWFTVWREPRWMPLLIGWFLVALFIWLAENIGTFARAWAYPAQANGWTMVTPAKLGAWYLLMYISFVLVATVHGRGEQPAGQA